MIDPDLAALLTGLARTFTAAAAGAGSLWIGQQWRRRRWDRVERDRCGDCGRILTWRPETGLYRPHVCRPRY